MACTENITNTTQSCSFKLPQEYNPAVFIVDIMQAVKPWRTRKIHSSHLWSVYCYGKIVIFSVKKWRHLLVTVTHTVAVKSVNWILANKMRNTDSLGVENDNHIVKTHTAQNEESHGQSNSVYNKRSEQYSSWQLVFDLAGLGQFTSLQPIWWGHACRTKY